MRVPEAKHDTDVWLGKPTVQRTSLLPRILVAYLVAGVPVLFALRILTSGEQWDHIVYPLSALFGLVATANCRQSMANKAHISFYLLFSVLFLATMCALISEDARVVYSQFVSLVMCFVWASVFVSIYFLIKTYEQYRSATKLLDRVGIGIALSVFLSYVGPERFGFWFGETSYEGENLRAFGPFGDQVGFALGYFALRSVVQARWLTMPLHIGAILLTGTRGAVASLTVGVLWLMLQALKQKRGERRHARILPGVIWMVSVALILIFTRYGETALIRLSDMLFDPTASFHRRTAWELGLEVYLDNPIVGTGYLGFNRVVGKYDLGLRFGSGVDLERAVYTAQNQYLQTATDGGPFGLLFLVLFLHRLFTELRKARAWAGRVYKLDLLSSSAWIVALALGNQAAVWLLPTNITTYLFFLVGGLSLRLVHMQEQDIVPYVGNQNTKSARSKNSCRAAIAVVTSSK